MPGNLGLLETHGYQFNESPVRTVVYFSSCHVQLLKHRCGVSELKRQDVIVKVIVLENEVFLKVDQLP